MKLSEKWLRTLLDVPIDSAGLENSLTLSGLEVDACERVSPPLPNVLVAQIEKIEPHPDATKLSVCLVSDGSASLKVVCGAPNVRVGMKTALAQINSVLPGDQVIEKTVIRGVESNGMLCSASELGLGEDSDGIIDFANDVNVGDEVFEALSLDDNVFDIDITPNRGDCFSLLGIARDLAVMTGGTLKELDIPTVESSSSQSRDVEILADHACQNYVGRVIEGINILAKTPTRITECLRRSGVRPINPIVDVTNFVMLELGQPMHAFDDNCISGTIEVRESIEKEAIHLLDGQEIILNSGSLVIADQTGPIALAGVMGGLDSSVTDQTANIFLESAFFDPICLSGVARKYRMHTDASMRFERGVDPLMQLRAVERATSLVLDICGGAAGPVTCVSSKTNAYQAPIINFSPSSVNRLVGVLVPDERIIEILKALEITVKVEGRNWVVTPPSFRFDLAEEADLVEEVARIEGYDTIPVKTPIGRLSPGLLDQDSLQERSARRLLVSKGYSEAITYSFVSIDKSKYFSDQGQTLKLSNPISNEMEIMRPSILPGLLDALMYNLNRQQTTVNLFEQGMIFWQESGNVRQERCIAGLRCGLSGNSSWATARRDVDFYDIKHDVEMLLVQLRMANAVFKTASPNGFHPTQTAEIFLGADIKGRVGAVDPVLLDEIGVDKPVFCFELSMQGAAQKNGKRYDPVSKYPSVKRDIDIVLDRKINAGSLLGVVWASGGDILKDLQLLDVYQGQGIDFLKKSITLSLIFQNNSRTLTDSETENACKIILSAIEKELGGILRD